MFSVKIKFYEDELGKEFCSFCLIPANTFNDALSKLKEYYGEEYFGENDMVLKVEFEYISPDNIMIFESVESINLYTELKSYIKENAFW